jgi:primosomal protein N' (replication factor Y) (superfamily II helicase)
MLFLNRRGYATSVMCPVCGYETCPNCSVKMTYHKQAELMMCHVCGVVRKVPAVCCNPECKRAERQDGRRRHAARRGGREARCFPRRASPAWIPTPRAQGCPREILGQFRRGDIDILIGTQMIAKGLDFPNVTLVGVIHADLSLQMPDFRAAERTFQLLTQVAGRAGRGDVPGEVLIQTYAPFHPAVQSARTADFETFFDQEIEMRREMRYPPFVRLTTVLFKGRTRPPWTPAPRISRRS